MDFFTPQNPGIGGLDELTTAETIIVQSITALGDPGADRILFWDSSAGGFAYLTAGTGLTITGTTIEATSGSGDMVLASVQTNSGAKTFLDTTFLLRNVANTFNGSFVNTNTGNRIYTLKDANGTLAFTSDITGTNSGTNTGDQTSIVGITGTMAQFDTAVTDGNIVYQSQALGTPSSGTVTNLTGTASININGTVGATTPSTGSFTTVTTSGNIELGHATDTTLSRSAAGVLAVEGVVIPSISSTNTLTNKRRTPRVYSAANNASLTPEIDTYDVFHLTAMSAATTINNKSTSTPTDGELMRFRFLDNGTARALTWGTDYVAKAGVALPSTTILSKNLVLLFEWNANLTKWNLLASGQEA